MIAPALPENGTVIDLGCGPGRVALPVASLLPVCDVVGMDISGVMLGHIRRGPNISTVLCDGRTIPAGDNTASCVYSGAMFQHIPPDAVMGYLKEIGRVLEPGGRCALQFVEGQDEAPFMHQLDVATLLDMAEEAGLVDVGAMDDPWQFNWIWLYGEGV